LSFLFTISRNSGGAWFYRLWSVLAGALKPNRAIRQGSLAGLLASVQCSFSDCMLSVSVLFDASSAVLRLRL